MESPSEIRDAPESMVGLTPPPEGRRKGTVVGLTSSAVMRTVWFVVLVAVAACSGSQETTARTAPQLLEAGSEAYREGDLGEAATLYEDAIRLDRQSPYGYYNLGLVEQARERARRAEQNYRRAIELDPNFAPALFNLAILRSQADATDEAVALYQQVVTLQPENAGAHYNLGMLLYQLGRREEAAKHLGVAIRLNPKLADPTFTGDSPRDSAPPVEAPPVDAPPVRPPDETA